MKTFYFYFISLITLLVAGCQKMERPVLGDYLRDDQVLPEGPLRFFAPFNDSIPGKTSRWWVYDSISKNPAMDNPLKLVTGVSGLAIQGANGAAIKYLNANDMKSATSFTVAFWMKQKVNTRTEFYFSLIDNTYGWSHSALFMMAEHVTASEATVKIGVMDQWMEFPDGNKLKKPMFDGNWHHWVIIYDETTSKMSYYFDGALVANPPASATDVKKDGNPRGKLDFTKTSYLVLGGWNKHVSLEGPTDDWVSSYTGAMDQFRMYNKVLTAAEVADLFNGKK